MLNAIAAVHLRNGLWNTSGGVELPLVYAAAAAALGFTGPVRSHWTGCSASTWQAPPMELAHWLPGSWQH